MQIKGCLKASALPLIAIGFVVSAWVLAQWIPATARMNRWQKAATELSSTSPTAEVCAVVAVHFNVRLSAEDVAVWRQLQQDLSAEDALRIVVQYARGRVE